MSVVLRSIEIETVAYIRAPAGPVPRAETATGEIACYRTIGSLQALSLAATASAVTIALFLWAV